MTARGSNDRQAGSRPAALFDRLAAERLVSLRELEPARRFFHEAKPLLALDLSLRFRGLARAVLRENPDNYGIYFLNRACPVPFLWFGMAWGVNDPAGTLPSWGASLEVNGDLLKPFQAGEGGLLQACSRAVEADARIRLFTFQRHVELASWRSFEWLLGSKDQQQELLRFWAGYLSCLARSGVPEAVQAFWEACG